MKTDKEMTQLDEAYYRALGQAKTPREMEAVFNRGRLHVGQRVMFKSGSAPGGWRHGTIVKLGHKRAVVRFMWLTSRREDEKSVPFSDILERRREDEIRASTPSRK